MRGFVDARLFEGLSDTSRILLNAMGGAASPPMLRLQRDLESAYDSRPTTISAARRWLEQLEKSIGDVANVPGDGAVPEGASTPENEVDVVDACVAAPVPVGYRRAELSHAMAGTSRCRRDGAPICRASPQSRRCVSSRDWTSCWLRPSKVWTGAQATREESEWLESLRHAVSEASRRANERIATIERLGVELAELAAMEYGFLYDKARHLLAIGYNVAERRQDSSYYDLLASEARLSCFVAIAQGQLPQENWFALGRLLTTAGDAPILLSWSGSMFEYLMPLLVMPTYENSLLDQTYHAAVKRQIEYGRQRGVPWGMSESGIQRRRCRAQLSIPRIRRAGLGIEARPGRGSRRRAVCVGAWR
jgi:hypothetical protein